MDRVRVLRLLLPAALLLAGCRNDPYTARHIEEVNNQNRQLEDVIYEQDYELNVLRQEVADLKRRAEAQRSDRRRPLTPRIIPGVKQPPSMEPDLGPMIEIPEVPAAPADIPPPVPAPRVTPEPMPDRSSPPRAEPPPRRNPPRSPPPMDLDAPPTNPLPLEEAPSQPRTNDLNPPARPDPLVPTPRIPPTDPTSLRQIEAEPPPSPPETESLPPPLNAPTSGKGPLQSNYPTAAARGDDSPPAPPAELAKAVSIVLHPLYTGGEDTDGRPGDEGLSLLIEPRTKGGDFTPVVGKVSIALLDPTRKGDEARVARWDFDADYVQRRMKTLTNQRGILLQTTWPNGPPKSNRLKLFVRLETADGDKLQTEREVFVALPGQLSNRWTPRTAGEPAEVARQPGAASNVGDRVLPEAAPELPPEQRLPTQLTPPPEAKPEPAPEPKAEIPARKERPKKGLIVPPAALGDDPR